jgi:phage-related protein
MGHSVSVATAIEKNRLSSDKPFLVCLEIQMIDPVTLDAVGTAYLVDNTESIEYNGQTFTPVPFDIDMKAEAGKMPEVTLQIKDFSKAVQGYMEGYGGGIGFKVTIFVVNAGNLAQPPEIFETFEVVGASSANYVVTFQLGMENLVSEQFPRRHQTRDFCQWRFKDPNTCRYAGSAAACSMTLTGPQGCIALNNTKNFGAFPGVTSNGASYG